VEKTEDLKRDWIVKSVVEETEDLKFDWVVKLFPRSQQI
jgi:hypothetical protein